MLSDTDAVIPGTVHSTQRPHWLQPPQEARQAPHSAEEQDTADTGAGAGQQASSSHTASRRRGDTPILGPDQALSLRRLTE